MRIFLFMPIYQREENVEGLIEKIPDIVDKIYVVIDEPDKSILDTLKNIEEKEKRLEVEVNHTRKGVGNALRQAIECALKGNYDIFVAMAANGKDNPLQIPRFIKPIVENNYDYVQGSRYLEAGVSQNLPLIRKIITRILPLIWRAVTGIKCTEVTNGFRAYKLSIFENKDINIWQGWLEGYQLEYYIHYMVIKQGYKITEVPVSKTYSKENARKHTKIRIKDGWSILSPLFYLKLGLKK